MLYGEKTSFQVYGRILLKYGKRLMASDIFLKQKSADIE